MNWKEILLIQSVCRNLFAESKLVTDEGKFEIKIFSRIIQKTKNRR
jgi:hypothetical protein